MFSNIKNDFEIGEIVNITKPSQESLILDIGSGSGHHVNAFNRRGVNAIGLDISPDMVAKAKKQYPSWEFKTGDALDFLLFALERLQIQYKNYKIFLHFWVLHVE